MSGYIPKFIKEIQSELPRNKVTADYWNSLFNRLITQGDHTAEYLDLLLNKRDIQAGSKVQNSAGVTLPDTKFIRYMNLNVTQDGEVTFIHGTSGPKGDKGDPGDLGPAGPKGEIGTTLLILGRFNTFLDLQASYPTASAGMAFAVGTEADNTVYVWDVNTNSWSNIGNVQGPQGLTGPQGPQGPQGIQGIQGPIGGTAELQAHASDTTIHVTSAERSSWLTLGEGVANAYRGDRGKIAYDHSQTPHQSVINGAATSVVNSNLTASRALISDVNGKIGASAVTAAELGHLTGVTSGIQAQITGKLGSGDTAANSLKVNGSRVTVSTTAPSNPAVNDIWIDIS